MNTTNLVLRRAELAEPLLVLDVIGGIPLVMLHGSDDIVYQYADLLARPIAGIKFVVSYSQHLREWAVVNVRDRISALDQRVPGTKSSFRDNVLYLMNSKRELEMFKIINPELRCALVNNCFTLPDHAFGIDADNRIYSAVYNAKPYLFKRHYLASLVGDLALISYAEESAKRDNQYFDLRSLSPAHLSWNIGTAKIRSINNKSYCGLLLSASEGACYASAEYLLCGLPVVSTRSEGGRDEYYTSFNSIIVDDDPTAVAAGVADLVKMTRNNEIDHSKIRLSILERQQFFRMTFAESIAEMFDQDPKIIYKNLTRKISMYPKLNGYCNYWKNGWKISASDEI